MARLVWVDVETTGLVPRDEALLEIGVIITDAHLVELSRFQSLVEVPASALAGMIPVVRAMHEASGLLAELERGAPALRAVHMALEAFFERELHGTDEAYLAGSSVYFDRSFLAEHTPSLLSRVEHRMVDVSTLKVLAKLWCPERGLRRGHPPAHRVLADLEASMAELRHWLAVMFRPEVGPTGALALLG